MPSNPAAKSKPIFPLFLIIVSLIAFVCSFIIMLEKIELYQNPSYVPPCNINPFISCGTVMATHQASAFGFPNPLIGIAGFSIVAAIGFALLAGAQFKRWFWIATNVGLLLATAFVYWLFSQSVFVIGALCPYCMVVWAMTIPLFWYTTVRNIREGALKLPPEIAAFCQKYQHWVLAGMYLVIILSILYRFWTYWKILL